jgi:hypothetical protein
MNSEEPVSVFAKKASMIKIAYLFIIASLYQFEGATPQQLREMNSAKNYIECIPQC